MGRNCRINMCFASVFAVFLQINAVASAPLHGPVVHLDTAGDTNEIVADDAFAGPMPYGDIAAPGEGVLASRDQQEAKKSNLAGEKAEDVADESVANEKVSNGEANENEAKSTALESLPLGMPAKGFRHARANGSSSDSLRKGEGGEIAMQTAPAVSPRFGGGDWLVKTVGALIVTIGAVFLCRGVVRRFALGSGISGQFGAGGRAPSGLLAVLGRYPVGKGQTLVLLQLDRRVLLVSQSSGNGGGFQTLCEVTDAEEVASILLKAQDDESKSLSRRFSSMLRTLERDPSIAGDTHDVDQSPRSLRRARAVAVIDEPEDPLTRLRQVADMQEGAA